MANKTKVIHIKCGGQVAWYLGSYTKSAAPMLSKDWLRMDGSHPMPCEKFRETCTSCGEEIRSTKEVDWTIK